MAHYWVTGASAARRAELHSTALCGATDASDQSDKLDRNAGRDVVVSVADLSGKR